jgi:hypothetical protein
MLTQNCHDWIQLIICFHTHALKFSWTQVTLLTLFLAFVSLNSKINSPTIAMTCWYQSPHHFTNTLYFKKRQDALKMGRLGNVSFKLSIILYKFSTPIILYSCDMASQQKNYIIWKERLAYVKPQ